MQLHKNIYQAWDGVFTPGQIQEIINMALLTDKRGLKFADMLSKHPPISKKTILKQDKWASKVKPLYSRTCPKCGGTMKLYPVNSDPRGIDRVGSTDFEDTEGKTYKSMWLCGKSCNKSGCWYEEYNIYSVEEYRKSKGGIYVTS